MKKIFAILSLFLITSCASGEHMAPAQNQIIAERYEIIIEGMSLAEVVELLGEPYSRSGDTIRYQTYTGINTVHSIALHLSDDIVSKVIRRTKMTYPNGEEPYNR